MTAYYNEIDPFAAAWLRVLIDKGHIAPGVVDERSIEDVRPDDLAGYSQCHFFAGIGGWSHALRLAGWPDNKPIWTASCPCQPFSQAGPLAGFNDKRHLWPSFYWLVTESKPGVIIGEQVASKAANPWLDLVQTDLEAMDYAFGAVAFPSASVGAPHMRDRTYWAADSNTPGAPRFREHGGNPAPEELRNGFASSGELSGMADNSGSGLQKRVSDGRIQPEALGALEGEAFESGGDACRMGYPYSKHAGRNTRASSKPKEERELRSVGNFSQPSSAVDRSGPTNGFWKDVDWLGCRDGKWRPVEPGTFPLADGVPARVGRLRGYGNAINVHQAKAFIEAFSQNR